MTRKTHAIQMANVSKMYDQLRESYKMRVYSEFNLV